MSIMKFIFFQNPVSFLSSLPEALALLLFGIVLIAFVVLIKWRVGQTSEEKESSKVTKKAWRT